MCNFKFIFVNLFTFLLVCSGYAQQLPNFGLYREYQTYLNPAAFSADYFILDLNAQIGMSYRKQWSGFDDGSPTTGLLGGSFISDQANTKLIYGGSIIFDKAGALQYTGVYGRLGVLFSKDPFQGGLSAALSLGYKSQSLALAELRAQNITEIIGSAEIIHLSSPDMGLGVYYHRRLNNENIVYTGVSIPQIFSLEPSDPKETARIKSKPHLYGLFGYINYLDDNRYLEGSTWIRYTQNSPLHIDLSVKYQMNKTIWIGTGYSTSKIVHFETGIVLFRGVSINHPMRISYSYELTSGQINNSFGNTHEICLSYAWNSRRR